MRENRTYGSEGGEIGQPIFPTPIGPVGNSGNSGQSQVHWSPVSRIDEVPGVVVGHGEAVPTAEVLVDALYAP